MAEYQVKTVNLKPGQLERCQEIGRRMFHGMSGSAVIRMAIDKFEEEVLFEEEMIRNQSANREHRQLTADDADATTSPNA